MKRTAVKQEIEKQQYKQHDGAELDRRVERTDSTASSHTGNIEADCNDRDDPNDPDGTSPCPAAPGARQPTELLVRTVAVALQPIPDGPRPALVAANDAAESGVINLEGGGQEKLTVVIVGGGPACFSALETLIQAPQKVLKLLSVFIVDDAPYDQLGRGAPFRHAPGIAGDFLYMNMTTRSVQFNKQTRVIQSWLEQFSNVEMADFMLRRDVGEVLGRRAAQVLRDAADADLPVRVIQGRAFDIRPAHDDNVIVDVRAEWGRTVITAQAVILTIGNEGSSRYEALRGPGFIDAPWSSRDGVHLIPNNAVVAIAGSSLSGMDVASVLEAQGHKGPIHMFSPQGRIPGIRPLHGSTKLKVLAPECLDEVLSGEIMPLSLEAVIRLVQRELHAHGLSWVPIQQRLQDYLTMRPRDFLIRESRFTSQMNSVWGVQKAFDDVIALLWRMMSKEARGFVLQNLGTFAALQWSAAPPTGHRIMEMLHTHRLILHRASSARRHSNGRFIVTCKDGSEFEADVFVDASGFAGGLAEFRDPLIRAMCTRGMLTPDETGLGAKVRFEDGRLIDVEGLPTAPIWAGACALTRGTYLLSNELGEATHSAARSAHSVIEHLTALLGERELRTVA